MRDFTGHELQVGDIVIIMNDETFAYARVQRFEPDSRPYFEDRVWLKYVESLDYDGALEYWCAPKRVIWHSSEYVSMPGEYAKVAFELNMAAKNA